jgi:hypothetical protein
MTCAVQHHECPQCQEPVNAEHFAEEDYPTCVVSLLFCEFCNRGWESIWMKVGGMRSHHMSAEFGADRPTELGKFLQRLKDRCAA